MKVLLIRTAEEWIQLGITGYSPYRSSLFPPLGLLYLGAVLEKNGYHVEIIDFGAETFSKEKLAYALQSTDVVGMSVYTNNYQRIVELSRIIKELAPNTPQIIGGPHCIFLREHALVDFPHVKICCMGEGEHVITDIMLALQGKKKLSEIPGISYREHRQIKEGKPLRVIEDLDILPFPARHLVDKYTYQMLPGGLTVKKRFTTVITSRGCPFHCRFCTRCGGIIDRYGFRRRSAENVVQELMEIGTSYGSAMIVDDNFLADRQRAHKIFDLLLEKGSALELFILGARIDSADKELYQKMKRAHVTHISYGIESGNQDVLDFYDKRITLRQIRDTLTLARRTGFFTVGSFILGAPIETKQHIENTIRFACSLPLDMALFGQLKYEMGSELWSDAVKKKKINKREFLASCDPQRGLGNFTSEELQTYSQEAFRRFYLRPSYVINQIYRAFLLRNYDKLYKGIRFLTNI